MASSDSRDGAKRLGVSLGPQANQILQRLYDPHLGPGNGLASPGKANSPMRKDHHAGGGGGVLKPRRMNKTSSVVTLAPSSASNTSLDAMPSPILRQRAGGGLGSSASVAVMHPSLAHVRITILAIES